MNEQSLSLVTGGCGFIGRHLVQELIKCGQPVRVVDPGDCPDVFQGKADVWNGSILDRDLLHNAMQGVSVVYHLAGIPHLWLRHPNIFNEVNVKGTQTVLEVARHHGLKKFVHTSSETVLRSWNNKSETPIDETQALPDPHELPGPYSRSKLMAELQVMQAIKQGLPAVIVYPTVPVGAGDVNLTPPIRMIRDFLSGKNLAYMECNLNIIPVQAVAEGHIAAAEFGRVGQRYILGQDNLKMSELLAMMEQQLGRKMPRRRVSYAVAMVTAHAMELAASFSGKAPSASVEGVRLAGANMRFDCSKAQDELGLSSYSISQALEAAAEWLAKQEYI